LAWGSAKVRGRGTGSFVRQFSEPDLENAPDILPLSFAAAKELGVDAGVMAPSPTAVRWINFAGPPGVWKSWLFAQALTTATSGLRDKVVFVGALPERGFLDMDQYATPYVHGGRRDVRGQASLTPGVEFHATMLANLLDKAWLRRASSTNQAVAVVLIGLLLTPGVLLLNPWRSAGFCLAIAGGITMSSFLLPWRCFIWWSWLVPVAVQIPAGYIWGVGYRYFVLEATRRRMKRAFSAYLSPVMAEQISIRDDLLELGGQEVDATVMFTDLENFTNMSEGLPPSEVSRILITYFNRTTRAILEEDGTIIKYIGDAVMAVWGAPLPDSRMADRAVRAAWGMIVAGRQEIEGRQLRTRIGVHTGMVLAGNLGSDFRFDYTLIGDTTNLASRLEGLNKHLGTQLLISDATFKRLTIPMVSRPLGRFRVVGRKDPVILHEILGLGIAEPITALLLKQYAAALALFDAARFVEARTAFAKAAQMRAGSDGPSNFFLAEVERRLREETTSDTDTVVAILSK
jgi:adenylate cyclase